MAELGQLRKFVRTQLRKTADLSTLTQAIIRKRYQTFSGCESLSTEDRQLLKKIVEEELLKMHASSSSDDEPLINKIATLTKRKRTSDDDDNDGHGRSSDRKRVCPNQPESPDSGIERPRKEDSEAEEERRRVNPDLLISEDDQGITRKVKKKGMAELSKKDANKKKVSEDRPMGEEKEGRKKKTTRIDSEEDEGTESDASSEEEAVGGKAGRRKLAKADGKKTMGKKAKLDSEEERERRKMKTTTKTYSQSDSEEEEDKKVQARKKTKLDNKTILNRSQKADSESDSEEEEEKKPPVRKKGKPEIKKADSASDSEEEEEKKMPVRKKGKPEVKKADSEEEEEKKLPVKKGKPEIKKADSESDSEEEEGGKLASSTSESEEDEDKKLGKGTGENVKECVSLEMPSHQSDSDSSSSLPSLDEEERRPVKSTTEGDKKKSEKGPSKSKKRTGDQGPPGEEDPAIARLKRYITACGARRNYKKLFDGCKSKKSKIEVLKQELEKLGVHGNPSLEKCKKAKLRREEKEELAALDLGNIIETAGRPRRRAVANSWEETGPPCREDYHKGLASDSDSDHRGKKRLTQWANLKGIISDDGDSD
ncbi:HIRA-interacting protein 3 isoform X1 [Erpetoichthys calabaricus]|uniref:HIRA-interacting protein 3 isoform X1 n=1 Tax=Erpetoichthys calabaricus TaxID=27687 RepID=UPI0022344CC8|nr:HIRA-interacting protein 3 isoform X1 [Erpetoichthys calabaricus]